MGTLGLLGAALAASLLGSCAPRPAPEPAPAPPPPRLEPARPPAPVPAPPADWRDGPLSPGDWSYRRQGVVSLAAFGPQGSAVFVISCEASRRISLARIGAGAGRSIAIRTTFGERSLPASATLAASDPLLDQIVFSRGRFLVQAEGLPALILPAWPEPARVIEDCRA